MYLAGEQLFNDGDLKDWLDARLQEAVAYIDSFTAENFAAYSDMALESAVMSRYRVPDVLLLVLLLPLLLLPPLQLCQAVSFALPMKNKT